MLCLREVRLCPCKVRKDMIGVNFTLPRARKINVAAVSFSILAVTTAVRVSPLAVTTAFMSHF